MSDVGPIFECVPNFSEGCRPEVLEALRRAADVPQVQVLGIDSDVDHNRAVLTLVGPGPALSEAVFRTMQTAMEQIDLRRHQGLHPRIGAVDVVPFVPWHQADMAGAIALAHALGERVGAELQLPVFFYGEAALIDGHRRLAQVRRGQFEGLEARLATDPPDRGPRHPHPSAGAVAIGARRLLIAFNVYLGTTDLAVARAIARSVRGSSGGLVGVQALAMDTRRQGRLQVSMNLIDYPTTPLPQALEFVRREAARFGVSVLETEVVGLMPLQAVQDIVRYYLQMPRFDHTQVLETALGNSAEWQ
ncbi:MAG: glutamate formimidoyltransferase [Sulfobacillus acidophilus]|uniref:glutamate formimidoyltransferase n=1 Tax=Sulfobacillus acidophilus TaxID=53633 RepID=A0A2T2WMQ5_9FIRM|nr:MAG: glutamate formimidoyltransferase [Sulfobacillus acidophilus]